MEAIAKALLVIAAVIAAMGLVLLAAAKLGLHRLPGDVVVRRGNFRLYAPIGVMVTLSVILTIVLSLISRR